MSSIETARHIANVDHWPLRFDLLNMLDELKCEGAMNHRELREIHIYLLLDRPMFALLMMNQHFPGLRQLNFFWILLILPITGVIRVHRLAILQSKLQSKEVRISLGMITGLGLFYGISYLFFLIVTI